MTVIDLLDLIGSFAGDDSGPVAKALALHARDALAETNCTITYPELIAEIYWRSFFDPEHASKYGTSQMVEKGPHMLREFANYLIASFAMDAHQIASGNLHDSPEQVH